jgi:hypothetical protein
MLISDLLLYPCFHLVYARSPGLRDTFPLTSRYPNRGTAVDPDLDLFGQGESRSGIIVPNPDLAIISM